MKRLAIVALIFASANVFAGDLGLKKDIAKVRAMAKLLVGGKDVRVKVEVYNNADGNPCAEEGVSYFAHIELRKTVMGLDPDGNPSPQRQWKEVNMYSISKAHLDAGAALEDAVCME